MKYLLDTHAFLWFLQNDDRLPVQIRTIIENNKDIYISIVSLWEIAIKLSIKKLLLTNRTIEDMFYACREKDFSILNITSEHVKSILDLPFIHRDPFDRMLIAQAKVEDMILLTCDQYMPQYSVKTAW